MKTVYMLRQYGSNFPGERCGFSDDLAKQLIADGTACGLDANGDPLTPLKPVKPVDPMPEPEPEQIVADDEDGLFQIDGLDSATIASLLHAGIKGPQSLKQFVAGGNKLTSITGIGASRAKILQEMYCEELSEPEDSEDESEDESDDDDDDDDQPSLFE